MTEPASTVVVVDTMAVSAIVNATRVPTVAASYRSVIAARPIVVSFATVTELRYGALKGGMGGTPPPRPGTGLGAIGRRATG